MVFMLMLVFYFLTMGLLTIFESKVLGLIQNSLSVFKLSFGGLYQFYLDFLKVLVKGFFGSGGSKFYYYYMNLIFIMLMMSLNFSVLMSSFLFKNFFMETLIIFLVLDGATLILKIILLSNFKSKYVSFGIYSIEKMYMFMEGVFSYLVLLLLIFFMNFLDFSKNMSILLVMALIFIFNLIKLFSTPFDYFESESELVGAGVLEFQGVGFLLWSLLEYGLILNNTLFVVYMFSLVFSPNLIMEILVFLFFIFMVFYISGLLVSLSFNSTFHLFCFIFFLFNLLILITIMI